MVDHMQEIIEDAYYGYKERQDVVNKTPRNNWCLSATPTLSSGGIFDGIFKFYADYGIVKSTLSWRFRVGILFLS